ncbi:MAG: hypothetical protein ACKVX9_16095 [Blastocatellia bacterium]
MIKKTGELKAAIGNDEVIAVKNRIKSESVDETPVMAVEIPLQQEKVNLIIHEWLTDMWLLTTGEEMKLDGGSKKHNGRPLAIVCDGQMKLMESKPSTLDALRIVGIEMS